jgi:hypothetical protein
VKAGSFEHQLIVYRVHASQVVKKDLNILTYVDGR